MLQEADGLLENRRTGHRSGGERGKEQSTGATREASGCRGAPGLVWGTAMWCALGDMLPFVLHPRPRDLSQRGELHPDRFRNLWKFPRRKEQRLTDVFCEQVGVQEGPEPGHRAHVELSLLPERTRRRTHGRSSLSCAVTTGKFRQVRPEPPGDLGPFGSSCRGRRHGFSRFSVGPRSRPRRQHHVLEPLHRMCEAPGAGGLVCFLAHPHSQSLGH